VRKTLLDLRTTDLLAKMAGMFVSEHPGERAAAAAQAHAFGKPARSDLAGPVLQAVRTAPARARSPIGLDA